MESPRALSHAAIDALADDIAETAAHLDAATHRLLALIREFDLARGWDHQGALSCAHWLAWRIGLSLGPAREKVRVAHRLAELPLIDEAFRRGELSFSKVRAMTRVATAANEATLLDQARQTTAAQLERICRFYRQARSMKGEDPRAIEDLRWVETRPTDDGMVSIQIRLLPDEAARLLRAIEVAAAGGSLADGAVALADASLIGTVPASASPGDASPGDASPGDASPADPSLADAAHAGPVPADAAHAGPVPADAAHAGPVPAGASPGDASPADALPADASPPGASPACQAHAGPAPAGSRPRPIRPPVEVILHIDASSLEGRTASGDGLSAETCRRVLCDAGLVPFLEDAFGRTIDVGRKTRTIPSALRRGLHARDNTCRFPGCTHVRFLDAHHAQHWIDGGETKLSNTALLCRRHHRYVHEFGFSLTMRDGEPMFFDPAGRELPAAPIRSPLADGSLDRLRAAIREAGLQVSAETNAPAWDGQALDYDRCVASPLP
jgi:hypothetical protein